MKIDCPSYCHGNAINEFTIQNIYVLRWSKIFWGKKFLLMKNIFLNMCNMYANYFWSLPFWRRIYIQKRERHTQNSKDQNHTLNTLGCYMNRYIISTCFHFIVALKICINWFIITIFLTLLIAHAIFTLSTRPKHTENA